MQTVWVGALKSEENKNIHLRNIVTVNNKSARGISGGILENISIRVPRAILGGRPGNGLEKSNKET